MQLYVKYFLNEFKSQLISVGPITLFLTVFFIASRQKLIDDLLETFLGMVCAAVGLTLFLFGLKGSIMPLAETVGKLVNERFSLPVVLCISFILGVLVTIAEPAVSSLRPLGVQVDRPIAPYLFYMMNDGVEYLLLSIGIGVGIAAVIGTARFVYRWPFKPIVLFSTAMCLLVSGLVYFLVEELRPCISLAWDAGAVTTGPVTVPILLALGKGAVTNSNNSQRDGSPMQGFGLVTLASLYPIICVHIYGLILLYSVDMEGIINSEPDLQQNAAGQPPLREIITGIRSIMPLSVALLGILKLLLRADLPKVTMKYIMNEDVSQASVCATEITEVEAVNSPGGDQSATEESATHADNPSISSMDPPRIEEIKAGEKVDAEEPPNDSVTVSAKPENPESNEGMAGGHSTENVIPPNARDEKAETLFSYKEHWARSQVFFFSLFSAQVGLILFNIGLHYGFTSLGSQVGLLLPAFYREIEDDPDSPLLSAPAGTVVAYLFIFVLGILATRAEPGLQVLAEEVKAFNSGEMKRKKTVYSVALGVSIGMVAGTSRLQLAASIFPYLAAMYAVAILATFISADMVAKVAWDSAGVTTGPVTIPFVLAIGLAYAKALVLPGGFGILACASAGPIITVLMSSFYSCRRSDS